MIMDALGWYIESLSAFWVSLAGGGLFKLMLIWCFIYWICCRRRRWRWRHHCCHHGCSSCGCRCGCCPCGDGADEAADDGDDEVVAAEA